VRPKLNVIVSLAALALMLSAAWSYSRADGSHEGKCEVAGLIFSKDSPCDGKCREASAQTAVMLHAVRAAVGERMKKEFGEKCPCTSGECTAENCAMCAFVRSKIVALLLREKVAARLGNDTIGLTHFVRTEDGDLREASCTFLKGETCPHCVRELAEATWNKANEVLFAPIGAFVQDVRKRVLEKVNSDGGAKCACTKGECTAESCPVCRNIKSTVFDPLLHQRVEARITDLDKEFTHSVVNAFGTTQAVPCTFLRGEPCPICANEMADIVRAKLAESATAQK